MRAPLSEWVSIDRNLIMKIGSHCVVLKTVASGLSVADELVPAFRAPNPVIPAARNRFAAELDAPGEDDDLWQEYEDYRAQCRYESMSFRSATIGAPMRTSTKSGPTFPANLPRGFSVGLRARGDGRSCVNVGIPLWGFPRRVGSVENMILVFQAFHFPSFAQARQSSCFFFRSIVRRKR